eukprot:901844_1
MSYYERFASISDWKVPQQIMDDAKRLDEELEKQQNDLIDESQRDDGIEVQVSIGDRIITVGQLEGIIRYKGTVHFDDRRVYGIELDKWSPHGHNGTINNNKYFHCIEGRGVFILPNGIKMNKGATISREKKRRKSSILMNSNLLQQEIMMSDLKADEHKEELGNIKRQIAKVEKKLHEIIILEEKRKQGDTLDMSQLTKIDRKKHLKDKLAELAKQMMDMNKANEDAGPKAPLPQINFNVGDRVRLERGKTGIVKFIGETEFAKGELLGLEMFTSDADGDGNNGSKNDKKYFECKPGHGHWTRRDKIKIISSTIPDNITELEAETQRLKKKETMSYYERFASISDWKVPQQIMDDAKRLDEELEKQQNDLIDESQRDDGIEVQVSIGDRIITVGQLEGIIRYKGTVHFDDRRVYGIELDKWSPHGHNGTINNNKYFHCIEGRGVFILPNGIKMNKGATISREKKRRKSSILMNSNLLQQEIMMSDLKADEHKEELGNIKRQIAKVEKKLHEIIILEEKRKQGDTLDMSQLTKIDRKKHLKDKLAELAKQMMDMNKANEDAGPKAPLPQINFNVGDRVRLERGKTGIVKFIGETEFAKGEVIGLELDTWTPAGHNGTVRGKIYFNAQEGRGYFTRRSNILNVVLPLVKPLQKKRMSIKYTLNPLNVGDKVKIIAEDQTVNTQLYGRTGVIKYKGYPEFADGEVIGIELDKWCKNAHNGTVQGVQVFETPSGRGVFVRRDEIERYDPEREKLEEIKKNLKLGDTVLLTNNRKGHVKYIGPVTGYDEMIGVELESWSPEAKDGRYDGFRYFTAPDGRGIFIKRNVIIDVIPLEAIQQNTGGSKGANSIIVEDEDMDGDSIMSGSGQMDDMGDNIEPKVGNRIKLTKGRFGIINSMDEMDDGTLEYAINISQLIDRTLLQHKQVDIAHKRQHSHGGAMMKNNMNNITGPKSTRQSGLLDIEDINGGKQLMSGLVDDDSDNYDSDDDNYTALGETIELRSGKIGTIRFIGPVHFAKGNWI